MNRYILTLRTRTPFVLAGLAFTLIPVPIATAATPRPAARAAAPARPAPSPAGVRIVPPAGMKYLPAQPLFIGVVQVGAADNFFGMMTGANGKESPTTDALTGALQLLKDQIDGPLAVAAYADASGKPESFVVSAHLKMGALTRELLNGAVALQGDDKNAAKRTTHRGQSLLTMDMAKASLGTLSVPLQPTFTVTDTDFLVIGSTLPVVRQAIDAAAGTGGTITRADMAAMMRELPPSATTDVWLFVPKPTGKVALPGKTPLPIPLAGLPIGPMAMALRFTPAGLRFEGLASVDRPRTASKP